METWWDSWNNKVMEEERRGSTPVDVDGQSPILTVNRRNIPIVKSIIYLDRNITWRLHIEMIKAKGLQKIYYKSFLFKNE
jgi:hypothetical protein